MDINHINPILDAFTGVLPMLGFGNVEKKNLSLASEVLNNVGVIVSVGVIGQIKGAIAIGMETEAAKQFASKMMMGAPVTELDNLAQSAIAEMCNMVCANTCSNFAQVGIEGLNISPPVVILGEQSVVKLASPVINVEYLADDVIVNIYISLVEEI